MDEEIKELINKYDIKDYIGNRIYLEDKGDYALGICPFHSKGLPTLIVYPKEQVYYCHTCNKGGNIISFVMDYYHMTFKEAVHYLPKKEMPLQGTGTQKDKKQRLIEIHKWATIYYFKNLKKPEGGEGLRYFQNRQLSEQTIKSFGLGFAGMKSSLLYDLKKKGFTEEELCDSGLFYKDDNNKLKNKFWNRVMFPIQDVKGNVIGFGGRVMGDSKPKYLNSPETLLFNKREHLYGLVKAKNSRRKYIILCEGYMDVISMHQAGFDNTAASLGTALTKEQADLLNRYTKSVYLMYDSDEAGVNAALRAIPILNNAGISARVVDLSPYKDPDEFIKNLGKEKMEERIRQATPSFSFKISHMEQSYDLNEKEQEIAFQHEMAKEFLLFSELTDAPYRDRDLSTLIQNSLKGNTQ